METAEPARRDPPESAEVVPLRPRESVHDPADVAWGRPPARAMRFIKAYWTTLVIVMSYLSLRLQARFRSEEAVAKILRRKHIRNARRIQRTICSLQGLFIKVGQLISIMTNFLPEEFRRQLEGLQDRVPPRHYDDIRRRFAEEFDGREPEEIFAHFDPIPIASASIGQVHRAQLRSGEQVAVKVQYPDIERTVRSDLKILKRIFRVIEFFAPFRGLDETYTEIKAMILEELDFRKESDNLARIAGNFTGRDDVGFPSVVDELSTERVMTSLFIDGTKVSDIDGLAKLGIDRGGLARRIVELYCQQIFSDGLYHADPHPGNLFVVQDATSPEGYRVVFLDFGAVAGVSATMREGIVEFIQAAVARDSARVIAALRKMGFVSRTADPEVFERIVEYFHSRFQEEVSLDSLNLRDVKLDPQKGLENLADLRRMDISLRDLTESFHVPKEWILLERTMLLLMGLCTELNPRMNPMLVIRPYLEEFVLGDDDWSSVALGATKDLMGAVTALPVEMRKFIRRANAGKHSVSVVEVDRSAKLLYRLGHQIIYLAIGITGAAAALILEGRGDLERAGYAWWVAKISGGLLVWSLWSTRGWMRRRR